MNRNASYVSIGDEKKIKIWNINKRFDIKFKKKMNRNGFNISIKENLKKKKFIKKKIKIKSKSER
jgi:hypothetical protein